MSARPQIIAALRSRFPAYGRRFLDAELAAPCFRYLLIAEEQIDGRYTGERRLLQAGSLDRAIEIAEESVHTPEAIVDLDAESVDVAWIALSFTIDPGGWREIRPADRLRSLDALLLELSEEQRLLPREVAAEMGAWIDRFERALADDLIGPDDFLV
jgi:hypothetical protein